MSMSDDSAVKLMQAMLEVKDVVSNIDKKVEGIKVSIDVHADTNVDHEGRLRILEKTVNQWSGSKMLLVWLISVGLSLLSIVIAVMSLNNKHAMLSELLKTVYCC